MYLYKSERQTLQPMSLQYCEATCPDQKVKQFCVHSRKCTRCKNANFRKKLLKEFDYVSNEKLCERCGGWVPPAPVPMTGDFCRKRCNPEIGPVKLLETFCRKSRDCELCKDEIWRRRLAGIKDLEDGCMFCCGLTGIIM